MMVDDADSVQLPHAFSTHKGAPALVLASDLAKIVGKTPDEIFGLYPQLYRRQATATEVAAMRRSHQLEHSLPSGALVTVMLAEEANVLVIDAELAERFKEPPPRTVQRLQARPFYLTRSTHNPVLPRRRPVSHPVDRPRNPLTKYYEGSLGIATPSDELPLRLVPIRLDIEDASVRVRDQLTWNANETFMTPLMFAQLYCQDMELPANMATIIAGAIDAQVKEHGPLADARIPDRRTTIRVELRVGNKMVIDQIQWDQDEPLNDPEQFAAVTCADLGLGAEFVPLYAHCIREAIHTDRKAPMAASSVPSEMFGHFSAPQDVLRVAQADEWCPMLFSPTDEEQDKLAQMEKRDARRKRRAARVQAAPPPRSAYRKRKQKLAEEAAAAAAKTAAESASSLSTPTTSSTRAALSSDVHNYFAKVPPPVEEIPIPTAPAEVGAKATAAGGN